MSLDNKTKLLETLRSKLGATNPVDMDVFYKLTKNHFIEAGGILPPSPCVTES